MAEPSDDITITALDALRGTLGDHDCVALLVCQDDGVRIIADTAPADVEQVIFSFLALTLDQHPGDQGECDNCVATLERLRNVFALVKSQMDAAFAAAGPPPEHLH